MNATSFPPRIGGRFHPATQQQFSEYAEHLRCFIGCNYIVSREMLARIYQYQNLYELEQVLKISGKPGPFDDAIPWEIRGTDETQAVIVARNKRAMRIIFNCISARRGSIEPKFTLQQLSALELFSSPLAHETAFRTLAGLRSTILSEYFAFPH